MRKIMWISLWLISIAIFTGCSSSTSPSNTNSIDQSMNNEEDVGWEVGKKAPEFTLNTLDHGTISLSQYSDKIVFLYFLGNT
jgi:hypothetical protein